MITAGTISKNTGAKAVLPFYIYASLSFLAACILLLINSGQLKGQYFQPSILAIVHTLALGWGTMMILGAGYQLVPVIAESTLYSEKLAISSFVLAAIGIPLLVKGFYNFEFDLPALSGAILIILSILCYLVNFGTTAVRSTKPNIETLFLFTAVLWLLLTVATGFLLLLNFSKDVLPFDSLHYLAWHSHMGIVGWFLLTVIGAASRLLPMFMLSKFSKPGLLWSVYILVNSGLILLTIKEINSVSSLSYYLPFTLIALGICIFIYYAYRVTAARIRKSIDKQMRLALASIASLFVPVMILAFCLITLNEAAVVRVYGFMIFFGWITAIIIAMTFKTLPFIIWNRLYGGHAIAPLQPADLFSKGLYNSILCFYAAGLSVCVAGLACSNEIVISAGAILLLVTAVLFNLCSFKLIFRSK